MRGLYSFSKKERISNPQDFKNVMKSGKKLSSKHYLLFIQENKKGFHRLGIVAKKEIGSATLRNRMKRYLREFFRLNKHQISGSYDIVILVKKGPLPKSYWETKEELSKIFTVS